MKNKRVIQPSKRRMTIKIFWQGATRGLALEHGKPVYLHEHWRHDEGWSSRDVHLVRSFESVTRDIYSDGTDCDGRMSSEVHQHWHRSMGVNAYGCPKWTTVSSGQRDYSAEAMGY